MLKVIDRKSVLPDSNMLLGCIVLSIKDKETQRKVSNVRFNVQGHIDKMKTLLVHNIVVTRQVTT